MRKLLFIIALGVLGALAACTDSEYSDVWTQYAEWRNKNNEWLTEQSYARNPDGTLYYTRVVPEWDQSAYVLMHYFNDRELTKDNLTPLYTSTVAVKYIGRTIDDTPFDSSYTMTDSLYYTTSAEVISGWAIALSDMHVGDSCEVLIPSEQGYYSQPAGNIPPFSALKFHIKLVDIPYYEVKPQ